MTAQPFLELVVGSDAIYWHDDGDGIRVGDGVAADYMPGITLDGARRYASATGRRCILWLHDSALEAWGLPGDASEVTDAMRATIAGPGADDAWSSAGWCRAKDVHIAVPSWSGELYLETPDELVRALHLWRDLIGSALMYSAPASALWLIDDRKLERPTRGPDLGETFRQSAYAVPAHTWARPLLPGESIAPFVSLYDRRGAYLAAWRSVELPDGEWHERDGKVDVRVPGYYLVDVRPLAPFLAGELLHDPFVRQPRRGDDEEIDETGLVWLTAPLAELAAELAAEAHVRIEIVRSIVAAKRTRALDRAAERLAFALRTIDERTDPVAAAVRDAVKDAYKRGTAHLEYGRKPPHPLHRPEWRHTIVDRHVANTYRGLRHGSRRPIVVGGVDGALFATHDIADWPDGLRDGPTLGAWRFRAAAPLTDERRAQLAGGKARELLFELIDAAASA